MSTAVRLLLVALLSGAAAYVATKLAMVVARRTDFFDHPHAGAGYKAHARPTPYLGGSAVLAAVAVGALVSGELSPRLLVLLGCTAALAVIGAVDDRRNVAPRWRIAVELLAAGALWSNHLGFTISSSAIVNLVLTAVWVVAVVNAFNLSDNMDGTCASLTAVSAIGIGCFALVAHDVALAAIAIALAAACLGFLPHNLAGPARIFLGDGGSMPLGFLVAGLALAAARDRGFGGAELLACGLLAGLPLLDTALVSVSRTRRGLTILTAGRDHLTHRLHSRLGSPRRVVLVLAPAQAALAGLAVAGGEAGRPLLLGFGFAALGAGLVAVVVLDSAAWRPPERVAVGGALAGPALEGVAMHAAAVADRQARPEPALELRDTRVRALGGSERLLSAADAA